MTKEEIIQGLYRGDSRAIKEEIKAKKKESAEIHEGDVRANIEGDHYTTIEEQKEVNQRWPCDIPYTRTAQHEQQRDPFQQEF